MQLEEEVEEIQKVFLKFDCLYSEALSPSFLITARCLICETRLQYHLMSSSLLHFSPFCLRTAILNSSSYQNPNLEVTPQVLLKSFRMWFEKNQLAWIVSMGCVEVYNSAFHIEFTPERDWLLRSSWAGFGALELHSIQTPLSSNSSSICGYEPLNQPKPQKLCTSNGIADISNYYFQICIFNAVLVQIFKTHLEKLCYHCFEERLAGVKP